MFCYEILHVFHSDSSDICSLATAQDCRWYIRENRQCCPVGRERWKKVSPLPLPGASRVT